jgi:hypothetical protein
MEHLVRCLDDFSVFILLQIPAMKDCLGDGIEGSHRSNTLCDALTEGHNSHVVKISGGDVPGNPLIFYR